MSLRFPLISLFAAAIMLAGCYSFEAEGSVLGLGHVRVKGTLRDEPPPGAPQRLPDVPWRGKVYEVYDMDGDGKADVGREAGSNDWWDIDVICANGIASTVVVDVILYQRRPPIDVPSHATNSGLSAAALHAQHGTDVLAWNQAYDNPRGAVAHAGYFGSIQANYYHVRLFWNPARGTWPELHDVLGLYHKVGVVDGAGNGTPFVEVHLAGPAQSIATALMRFGFDEFAGQFNSLPAGRATGDIPASEITLHTMGFNFSPFPVQR